MNDDKWINVDPRTNKAKFTPLRSRFSRRISISSDLKDNKRSRKIVQIKQDEKSSFYVDSNMCNACSGGGLIQQEGELICCPRCNGSGSHD